MLFIAIFFLLFLQGALILAVRASAVVPPKVRLVSVASADNRGITVSWESIPSVDGYELYRSAGENGNFILLDDIYSGYDSYYDDDVSVNIRYYYKIRAYMYMENIDGRYNRSIIYGEFSDVLSAVIPLGQTTLRFFIEANNAEIVWSEIDGADGYVLERSVNSDIEYKTIFDSQGKNSTSFDDADLKHGIKYYYRVRAYVEFETGSETQKTFGSFSNIIMVHIPFAKVESSVSSWNEKTVNIKWNTVAGAQGYVIERSAKSNSDFKVIHTTNNKAKSYNDVGRKLGERYYYRIRPFTVAGTEYGYGAYSREKSVVVTLTAPSIKNIKRLKPDTVRLTWTQVPKAQGYIIYRAADNGKFKQIKTIKGKSKKSLTVSRLTNGIFYHYRIVAYTTLKSGRLLGDISKAKTRVMDNYGYAAESWKRKTRRIFGKRKYGHYPSDTAAKKNMVNISIRVWDFGAGGRKITKNRWLTVHKKIAPTVRQIFREIYRGKEKFPIKDIGGYSWRGDNSTSKHKMGVAIDINPNENYMPGVVGSFWKPGKNPYSMKTNGVVVRTMRKYGFLWGASFSDYMHFSYFGG